MLSGEVRGSRDGHPAAGESGRPAKAAADVREPDDGSDAVDELLRSGVPLTLLIDLLSPFGPGSDRILAEEREKDDPPA